MRKYHFTLTPRRPPIQTDRYWVGIVDIDPLCLDPTLAKHCTNTLKLRVFHALTARITHSLRHSIEKQATSSNCTRVSGLPPLIRAC